MGKEPKHILKLSTAEKENFLSSFDFVVTDCDGVVWKFEGPMAEAKEGLQALRSLQKPIAFVSNNSFISREKYEDNFRNLGVDFDYEKDLLHPAEAIAMYMKNLNVQGPIYLLGSGAFRAVLEKAGFQCFSMPDSPEVASLNDIMNLIFAAASQPVAAVVYDVDLNFNLTKFYAAQYILATSPECLLIYGANDRAFRSYNHTFAGVGVFMDALTAAAQVKRKPIVMGKPSPKLGEMVVDKFSIKEKSRVLFIGDSLESDIKFAKLVGFQSLLVLSGVSTEKQMNDAVDEEIPDFYADSLADFVKLTITEE